VTPPLLPTPVRTPPVTFDPTKPAAPPPPPPAPTPKADSFVRNASASQKPVTFSTPKDAVVDIEQSTAKPETARIKYRNLMIEGDNVTGWQMSHSKEHVDFRLKMADGSEAIVRERGPGKPIQVKMAGEGGWREVPVADGERLTGVKVNKDGSVDATTEPKTVDPVNDRKAGPKVRHLDPAADGKWTSTLTSNLSTKEARDLSVDAGQARLAKGDAGGVRDMARAYAAKNELDYVYAADKSFVPDVAIKDRNAADFGARSGKEIARLHSEGKTEQAKVLQKEFATQLGTTFPDPAQRQRALDTYTGEVLDRGPKTATDLLPALAKDIAPKHAHLGANSFDKLSTMADAELAAGNKDSAKVLWNFAKKASAEGSRDYLPGAKPVNGELWVPTGNGGNMALKEMTPGSGEIEVNHGRQIGNAAVADVKAGQLEYSAKFVASAKSLPKLQLTDAELNGVPPTPEVMKKYLAAKYDGKMPDKFPQLQSEMTEYMNVGFAHTKLDVPDDNKAWQSGDLPRTSDGRLAGDCMVMNRAVTGMLSDVRGLDMRAVETDGHTRLVVSDSKGRGFVQSNENVVALARGSSLESRVESTIAKTPSLQVVHGMPSPVELGAPIAGDDFDASRAVAAGKLDKLTGNEAKMRASGGPVRDALHHADAFRLRSEAFFIRYQEAKPDQRKKMESERQSMATEYAGLQTEIGQLPTAGMKSFVEGQRKSGALNFSTEAAEFYNKKTPTIGANSINPFDPTIIVVVAKK